MVPNIEELTQQGNIVGLIEALGYWKELKVASGALTALDTLQPDWRNTQIALDTLHRDILALSAAEIEPRIEAALRLRYIRDKQAFEALLVALDAGSLLLARARSWVEGMVEPIVLAAMQHEDSWKREPYEHKLTWTGMLFHIVAALDVTDSDWRKSLLAQRAVENYTSALKEIIKIDPKSKVVMVTALGHEEKQKEAQSHGASGFIRKPFKRDDIISVIDNVLAQA